MRLEIEVYEARMRAPVVSARGSVRLRELVLVSLTDADGVVGYGEAAPLSWYDGVRTEDVLQALADCREVLTTSDSPSREEIQRVAVLPQAVAAIDLALWDLEGRRGAVPVWELLGATEPPSVEVNAAIAAIDRAGAAAEAAARAAEGFRCLKLKVGVGDDPGRIAAVRAAAGREVALRVDANGSWSVPEALAALRALEPAGIELCEEPCAGIEECAAVSAESPVAVALDESSALPGALERRACDAVCLKISRCGGISGVIDAARRARVAGYEVYLASTYDGPLGIAAALHAAAALRPELPCGLATLALFTDHAETLTPQDGRMEAPPGAGLGDGLLRWYGHQP